MTDETDYLELPDHLQDREGDNLPELIRIDPRGGYVDGNTIVMSRRAAIFVEFFRAVSAEPHELRRFADLIDTGKVVL